MKPIVIIPARGGSKGVPGKNIKPLGGKPLIYYSIESALEVFDDFHVIVSTDDENIKSCVEKTGLRVPFLRPEELAKDTVGTYEVLLHALDFVESTGYFPDTLILLQPTSPFRTGKHLQEALALFDPDMDMVVGVKETHANPYYVLFEEDNNGFLKKSKDGGFVTRQDCPKVYEYNGSIYIINVKSLRVSPLHKFRRVKKYVMDDKSSYDIDTVLDWKVAEYLAEVDDQKTF
jgi:N-acylneuraminate cytidylyltransferase